MYIYKHVHISKKYEALCCRVTQPTIATFPQASFLVADALAWTRNTLQREGRVFTIACDVWAAGIIFFILLSLCAIGSILNNVWLEQGDGLEFNDAYNWYFIKKEGKDSWWTNQRFENASTISGLQFLSYLIVMNTFIPISLYVSVEMARLGQSLLISYDPKMFDERTKAYSQARSTKLCEDLGQIDYVFSDKTGTLTQNVMVFQQCSIAGTVYGKSIQQASDETAATRSNLQRRWSAYSSAACPEFADEKMIDALISF